jgi:hypothetical protein
MFTNATAPRSGLSFFSLKVTGEAPGTPTGLATCQARCVIASWPIPHRAAFVDKAEWREVSLPDNSVR